MTRRIGSKYKKKINKLTFGLFDTLIDVCLFSFSFPFLLRGSYRKRRDPIEAIFEAIHITKITNANSLKRIIYRAKTQGYLEKKENYLKITKLGADRLKRTMPLYEEKRPWDGKLYLITYDVPEDKRNERDYLRDQLKQLGCALLQKSVWVTPYNPKKIIADFVKQRGLIGLVLVSELREGSGIGGKDILTAVERVYKLDQLNDEYLEFLEKARTNKLGSIKLIMTYLSILKKDPQLPFELLPRTWCGDDAFYLAQKELKELKSGMLNKK